ncbi:MAG TPA: M24 family metallopeptidase [Candidatus Binataceae bacterium]|nr:M24 family metallopeptidase [Candidatus Binataceae bacterium]
MNRVEEIAAALDEAALDGWLFYDFRRSDPIAYRVLELDTDELSTRRWFYFIPSRGEPHALVSAVEPNRLDRLPGQRTVYRSEHEMTTALAAMLAGRRRLAMDYSPNCAIPYVARVDAGTVELVRSLGVEVVTAADLIQRFEAALTRAQLESHRRAAEALLTVVNESFAEIARRVRAGVAVSELSAQRFVIDSISAGHGLVTRDPPIVAVNAHAALPHFSPNSSDDRPIGHGDLVLLDLWAREPGPDSVYADFTWMGFVGDAVPDDYAEAFSLIAQARDAVVEFVERRVAAGSPVTGEEADRAARAVIEAAGQGGAFVHRTGHSIGREVHANGVNLDSLETRDSRRLLDGSCFSVEPGLYFPGRFGVRTEIDMTIENGRAQVSTGAMQAEIVPLLAAFG